MIFFVVCNTRNIFDSVEYARRGEVVSVYSYQDVFNTEILKDNFTLLPTECTLYSYSTVLKSMHYTVLYALYTVLYSTCILHIL